MPQLEHDEVNVQPQIFLATTPATAQTRRMLRVRALDLLARLGDFGEGPCVAVLCVVQGAASVDIVLLRPRSVLVGTFQEADAPIDIHRDHSWLVEARAARAAVLRVLEEGGKGQRGEGETVFFPPHPLPLSPSQLGSPVAAVIVAPSLPAESRIVLDVEDHRQRVKVLGLDELAPLAAMLQAGAQLDQSATEAIAKQLGGSLWHDGERFVFELGLAPYELRLVSGDARQRFPLLEGANILGRRALPLQYEYRLAFPGDDSISADHAILICSPDGRVVLRDTSTNGSYIRLMDGGEERIHRAERSLTPGTILRIGETLLRLEPNSEF